MTYIVGKYIYIKNVYWLVGQNAMATNPFYVERKSFNFLFI